MPAQNLLDHRGGGAGMHLDPRCLPSASRRARQKPTEPDVRAAQIRGGQAAESVIEGHRLCKTLTHRPQTDHRLPDGQRGQKLGALFECRLHRQRCQSARHMADPMPFVELSPADVPAPPTMKKRSAV